MTVASLWKAIDRAGCGRPVGQQELKNHHKLGSTNDKIMKTPWNINTRATPETCPTLAVDLSIWICESLTSTVIKQNHSDPTLQLVYTRTVKLLKLGIKLVFVLEGKRRTHLFACQKRRTGTPFWAACQRCEEMLGLLGVPVVRAKTEGEALCALLNQRGIVDGVISNDGDCLLFGAKVLYTKFSLENLENKRVIRYDANMIKACIENHDDDDGKCEKMANSTGDKKVMDTVHLCRKELIAFAILTGSDLAGNGIWKVGCQKAIRFLKKCQIDNPLKAENAAIDELRSWAKAAAVKTTDICSEVLQEPTTAQQHCSCCGHLGNKRSHLKHGCQTCGTEAGEPCYHLSPDGKFRRALRARALVSIPKFDPNAIIELYQHPNDDQIPVTFIGKEARNLTMEAPRVQELLNSSLIVRGHNLRESRIYLERTLGALLAKYELSNNDTSQDFEEGNPIKKPPTNKNRPIPKEIKRALTRSGVDCFEIEWLVKATTTSVDGNPINELNFSTVEEQTIIKKRYPILVSTYEDSEREKKRQGDAEQERRRAFLKSMCSTSLFASNKAQKTEDQMKTFQRKRRGGFFSNHRASIAAEEDFPLRRSKSTSKNGDNMRYGRNHSKSLQLSPYDPTVEEEHRGGRKCPRTNHVRAPHAVQDTQQRRIEDDIQIAAAVIEPFPPRGDFGKAANAKLGRDANAMDRCVEDDWDHSTISSTSVRSVESNSSLPLRGVNCSNPMTPGHIHFLCQESHHVERFDNHNVLECKETTTDLMLSRGEIDLESEQLGLLSSDGRHYYSSLPHLQVVDPSPRGHLDSIKQIPAQKRQRISIDPTSRPTWHNPTHQRPHSFEPYTLHSERSASQTEALQPMIGTRSIWDEGNMSRRDFRSSFDRMRQEGAPDYSPRRLPVDPMMFQTNHAQEVNPEEREYHPHHGAFDCSLEKRDPLAPQQEQEVRDSEHEWICNESLVEPVVRRSELQNANSSFAAAGIRPGGALTSQCFGLSESFRGQVYPALSGSEFGTLRQQTWADRSDSFLLYRACNVQNPQCTIISNETTNTADTGFSYSQPSHDHRFRYDARVLKSADPWEIPTERLATTALDYIAIVNAAERKLKTKGEGVKLELDSSHQLRSAIW